MSNTANEGDVVADFLAAMRSTGVDIDLSSGNAGQHPIADGKLHRASSLTAKNKRNLNAWYVLHLDHPASGAFGDYAKGLNETWTSINPRDFKPEDKDKIRRRMEEAARLRAEHSEKLAAEAKTAAESIMAKTVKAKADHAYLVRKKLQPFPGLRLLPEAVSYKVDGETKTARAGWLIVPMFDAEATLVGVQTIQTDGVKRFLKGTPKAGKYHSIGKPQDGAPIIIAEGYATAARIYGATGHLAIVAFDSGNLPPVAQVIRKKYPKARIIIAADNDRFTTTPIDNPGLKKAKEAALAIRATVAVPHFADRDDKASDFDDLAQLYGDDALRAAIEASVPPKDAVAWAPVDKKREPEPSDEVPPYDDAPPVDRMPDGPDGPDARSDEGRPAKGAQKGTAAQDRADDAKRGGADEKHPLANFGHPHFRCLGVDETTMYYQPARVAQVIALPLAGHKSSNLFRLAPLQWWELEFPGKSKEGSVDWSAAINACVQACQFRRKFVSHNSVRGRGAWFEGETAVYHAGDSLIIDGEEVEIPLHRSKYVYDEGDRIPVDLDNPATDDEARQFLALCKSLRWSAPMSGYLLAGWCLIAPVCGFLSWRPHIWISGPSGAGKSTVIKRIVNPCLADVAHSVVGNTSEAGIRAALAMDALPVIFDEAEPKDLASQQRIRGILDLARVAASEAEGLILKGTANQRAKGFRARFMAVFASINTQIEGYADETRFTQLTLRAAEADSEAEKEKNRLHFEKLVSDIVALITPAFSRRLLARTIQNLPLLRRLVDVFSAAATLHLGAQRLGDQLGPMLAGAWLLNSTRECTVVEALAWIKKNDWIQHSAKEAVRDSERFMQHLTGFTIRNATPEGGTWERPIGELIEQCMEPQQVEEPDRMTGYTVKVPNKQRMAAEKALGRIGIKVHLTSEGYLVDITTTGSAMKSRILHNTEWRGTNLRQLFQTIEGCIPGRGNRYFSSGVNTPFCTFPVEALISSREPGEEG